MILPQSTPLVHFQKIYSSLTIHILLEGRALALATDGLMWAAGSGKCPRGHKQG
jgi:hypothetical protein